MYINGFVIFQRICTYPNFIPASFTGVKVIHCMYDNLKPLYFAVMIFVVKSCNKNKTLRQGLGSGTGVCILFDPFSFLTTNG